MSEPTVRCTVAQALVRFLAAQHVERDGERRRFFAGCFGIFGHGNVAGLGEALLAHADELPYVPARNEQAMVHIACGYARQLNRLGTFAVTTSVGPGATNIVTGAALATINRLPVLLLPGDTFATRAPHPVLQQLEAPADGTVSVNDALRPVSRYFDRIVRGRAAGRRGAGGDARADRPGRDRRGDARAAGGRADRGSSRCRRRSSPSAHGRSDRRPPAPAALARAAALIRGARRPLIVAGGGVDLLRGGWTRCARSPTRPASRSARRRPAAARCSPTTRPRSGRSADRLGGRQRLAHDADVVIGVGTRWSDFTTASKTIFQDRGVRFVNINVCGTGRREACRRALLADARAALERSPSGSRAGGPRARGRRGSPGSATHGRWSARASSRRPRTAPLRQAELVDGA